MIGWRVAVQRATGWDWAVFAIALGLTVSLYGQYWRSDVASAEVAEVMMIPPQRILLDHSQQIHLHGALGESVIQVEPGRIRFIASPCAGKQCIRAGWLSQVGDFAACLPNRISIRLSPGDEAFDSWVF